MRPLSCNTICLDTLHLGRTAGVSRHLLLVKSKAKNLQANFDAGLKWSVELQDLKVDVYGDAAVVTGYLVGTVTLPDGR